MTGRGLSVKEPGEPGDVPASFTFSFEEGALYVSGTAPMGEDQARMVAWVLAGRFGVEVLEAAASITGAGPRRMPGFVTGPPDGVGPGG